jgi:hypothetical protein
VIENVSHTLADLHCAVDESMSGEESLVFMIFKHWLTVIYVCILLIKTGKNTVTVSFAAVTSGSES